jgi:hypothetical protein
VFHNHFATLAGKGQNPSLCLSIYTPIYRHYISFGGLLRMIENDFDCLFPQETIKPVSNRGYEWKVVVDPTRVGHDPGMFFGRLFRIFDIRINRDEKSTWPDGIVFEHIKSGCRLTYQSGLLVDLTNSIVLRRKTRIRDRKRHRKIESIQKTIL